MRKIFQKRHEADWVYWLRWQWEAWLEELLIGTVIGLLLMGIVYIAYAVGEHRMLTEQSQQQAVKKQKSIGNIYRQNDMWCLKNPRYCKPIKM
jgi:hypothetical protein